MLSMLPLCMGPAVMEEGIEEEGGGATGSCLVAKQAVEFPQVLASNLIINEELVFPTIITRTSQYIPHREVFSSCMTII